MAKLCEIEREIIRRAACVTGNVPVLAQRFGISIGHVMRLQAGKRGWPLVNGLGARPWELKERTLIHEWHRRRVAQADAGRDRALRELDEREQPLELPHEEAEPPRLFHGVGAGKRHAVPPWSQPTPEEAWRLAALGPGSLLREK
jgi:hypothetical protein